MGILKYVGLIDASMNRFIHKELSNQAALKRVYRSWTYFRDISFSSNLLKLFLKKPSHIHTFLGAKDPLIDVNKITPLLALGTYTVLKEKHHKIPFHPAVLAYIQSLETNPHKKE